MGKGSISLLTDDGVHSLLEAPAEVIATIEHFWKFIPQGDDLALRILVQNRSWFGGEYFDLVPGDKPDFSYDSGNLRSEYLQWLCTDLAGEFENDYSLSFDTWKGGIWTPVGISAERQVEYDRFWDAN